MSRTIVTKFSPFFHTLSACFGLYLGQWCTAFLLLGHSVVGKKMGSVSKRASRVYVLQEKQHGTGLLMASTVAKPSMSATMSRKTSHIWVLERVWVALESGKGLKSIHFDFHYDPAITKNLSLSITIHTVSVYMPCYVCLLEQRSQLTTSKQPHSKSRSTPHL